MNEYSSIEPPSAIAVAFEVKAVGQMIVEGSEGGFMFLSGGKGWAEEAVKGGLADSVENAKCAKSVMLQNNVRHRA